MYITAMACLAVMGDPSVDALVGLCFFSFFGAQLLDLAQRALIVQRSRFESEVGLWGGWMLPTTHRSVVCEGRVLTTAATPLTRLVCPPHHVIIVLQEKRGTLLVNYNLAWTWGVMIGAYRQTHVWMDAMSPVTPPDGRPTYTTPTTLPGNIMGTFLYRDNFPRGGGMSLGNIAAFAVAVNVACLPSIYWLYDPKASTPLACPFGFFPSYTPSLQPPLYPLSIAFQPTPHP